MRKPNEIEPGTKTLVLQSVPMIQELKNHPSAKAHPPNNAFQIARPETVVANKLLTSGVGDHNGFRTYIFAYARAVPARVCAVVPDGLTEFTRALIFFHPLPTTRAGYDDGQYATDTGGWSNIYRYCEQQGAQLAASKRKIVFIMPIFNLASTETCGVFPDKWSDLIETILRYIRDDRFQGLKDADLKLEDIITASYSAGIHYMSTFLAKAQGLQPYLKEVWDYDGRFSTSKAKSEGLNSFAAKVLTYDQRPVKLTDVEKEAKAKKGIHIPLPRWQDLGKSSSFLDVPDPNVATVPGASLFVHGAMPRYLMYHSLTQTEVGKP